jgi:hypothetical protein
MAPVWDELRQRAALDAICAFAWARLQHTENGEARSLTGAWVSGSYFATLGVRAQLGRVLSERDGHVGADGGGPVMVVSDEFWRRQFNQDPRVIGTPFSINGALVTIVGVAPRGFFGTDVGTAIDVFIPISHEPLINGRDSQVTAGVMSVTLFARLTPGQTRDQMTAGLRSLQPQIREAVRPRIIGRPSDDPYVRDYLKAPFVVQPACSRTWFPPAGSGPMAFRSSRVAI